MDTLSLPLKRPLVHAGKTIDTLDLREPTVGELEEAANHPNGVTGTLSLISAMTAIPLNVLRKGLVASDYMKASDFLAVFTRPGQPISETSSPTSPDGSAGDPATPGV